ncbi:MAG TPA: glycoside hydrolase family 2 protein [Polyangia bacterium]|nr:glycoside hydrolase family 2 protein [Polyangia bacterium]
MLRLASLVVTVLMSLLPATAGAAELGPWSFRAAGGGYAWMPAVVPGCVHTDLLRAKKIADPFYGTNEKDQQWIEHTDWEYRSSFAADAALLAHERVDLVWKGLDTFAEVFVNGHSVLRADNMFRSWRVDVRRQLVEGANQVLVRFRSPIAAVKPAYDALGYRLPAINDQAPEMVSMFARKAPYHYGWDWGPRFVTSGIWRPVTLEAWDGARLDDVQVFQRELTDARARLAVTALVQATRAGQATLTVTPSDGAAPVTALAALVPGENRLSAEVLIDKPERWWPNGLGAQKLYTLGVALTVDGAARGARAARVGLRTLEVVSARDKDGKSFTVKVNGAPVFMKGANYIPSDSFVDRVTPARTRALLQSAADAHMNMLRVWGGGIYEDDGFYDLADELGLLVWQDFMFACSMYPGDDAFLENVRREAVENVRRLRNHASLALWAGNNEIEAAWQQWGWQWKFHLGKAAQATIERDYKRLFQGILPRVVAEEDPGRFYTRSSPSANEDGVPPNKLGWGDNHYWGVWHAEAPYTDYATHVSRFMSEYGFQSFPELASVASYTDPKTDWEIESPVMLSHQRHPRGNALIKKYMERDFRAPKDFASFLYLSQVLQATVIQYGAEAHRRRWPYNAGSLYWQLDDCWPVASWSGIDYYGRWKALHYAARRFFAPVLVSPVEDGGNVRVFVVSDRRADTRARMTIRLVDFDGRELSRHEQDVVAKANASAPLWSAWKKDILRGADPARVVLVAELREGATLLSRNLLSFMKARDLALPPPELQVVVEARGTGASVRVTAKRFARAVYLSTPDGEGTFSDNFFDLLPGESITVEWRGPAGGPAVDAARFASAVRTKTVRDTY